MDELMHYDAKSNVHGLKHDPFKTLVSPRPIGWISSMSADGKLNLAPYSFFNGISDNPHIVMFASQGAKDSQVNAEATGEFVCNMATWDLRDAMNATSASLPHGVSEFEAAGLTPEPSIDVKVPRVKESPVTMECKYLKSVALEDVDGVAARYGIVIGQVVRIHIDDAYIEGGMVDIARIKPIARLGYHDYAVVDEVFAMTRPGA